VYLHPWEIDPAQPRLEGGLVSRMRHYVNIGKTEARLAAILKRHRFAPVRDVFADALSQATNNPEVIHCAYS
jgi:hypothetical protein